MVLHETDLRENIRLKSFFDGKFFGGRDVQIVEYLDW